jgi:hypothetical protein
MGYEAVDFYITDSSPLRKPIAHVLVKVFSEDGRLVYTQAQTDVAGHVGFLLSSGFPYQARFYKQNVSLKNPRFFQVLEPPALNAFDVIADLTPPPTPTDRRLCTAYGRFRTATGSPAANVGLHFNAKFKPFMLDEAGIVTEHGDLRTDEEGYVQVNLIRCGQYEFTLEGAKDYTRVITVPDTPNVSLPDLLFPVVASVTFEPPPPYILPTGADLQVTPTLRASDGEVLNGTALDEVVWSSSEPDVLVVLPAGPKVTLRGVSGGVASILIRRANYSIIRYPDLPIAGQPAVVTVI